MIVGGGHRDPWHLCDRLARSVLDAAQTLERLRAWGVGLRSYCEPYLDTTGPFGEALFHITMASTRSLNAASSASGPRPGWTEHVARENGSDDRR